MARQPIRPVRPIGQRYCPYPRISGPLAGLFMPLPRQTVRPALAPGSTRRAGCCPSFGWRYANRSAMLPLSADKVRPGAGTEARTARKAAPDPHGRRERAAPWGGRGGRCPVLRPGGIFGWLYSWTPRSRASVFGFEANAPVFRQPDAPFPWLALEPGAISSPQDHLSGSFRDFGRCQAMARRRS